MNLYKKFNQWVLDETFGPRKRENDFFTTNLISVSKWPLWLRRIFLVTFIFSGPILWTLTPVLYILECLLGLVIFMTWIVICAWPEMMIEFFKENWKDKIDNSEEKE